MDTERTYVIGDVGGHVLALRKALLVAGMDPVTKKLPPDVTVVSLGDLIDRGPNSMECLALAAAVHQVNPDRYIQLLGNHEVNWLDKAPCFISGTPPMVRTRLREYDQHSPLYLSAVIEGPSPTMLTHAGLTIGLYELLGSPDLALLCERINAGWGSSYHAAVIRPGMSLGYAPTSSAGVCWADATNELILPWLYDPTPWPFDQVHGHSSAFDWSHDAWFSPRVRDVGYLDDQRRHVTIRRGGRSITGIDPQFGTAPHEQFAPLVLPGRARALGPPVRSRAR